MFYIFFCLERERETRDQGDLFFFLWYTMDAFFYTFLSFVGGVCWFCFYSRTHTHRCSSNVNTFMRNTILLDQLEYEVPCQCGNVHSNLYYMLRLLNLWSVPHLFCSTVCNGSLSCLWPRVPIQPILKICTCSGTGRSVELYFFFSPEWYTDCNLSLKSSGVS